MINVKEIGSREPEAGSEYPCLKISDKEMGGECNIVLFTSKDAGVKLTKNSPNTCIPIGSYRDDWAENIFYPYTGTLEISNS